MLKRRLIPKLLIKHRAIGSMLLPVLVTTRRFTEVIEIGDPVSQAKIYEAQLADELLVLGIDGNPLDGDEVMLALIERLASETFMPLCVGGGVRTVDDFGTLLSRGADKVSINAMALKLPSSISRAADRHGSQCVVVSIDYRRDQDGQAWVSSRGALHQPRVSVEEWAQRAADFGAGELHLCDIDRDGMGSGLDWPLCASVARSVAVPVILSGGCGLAEHFVDGFIKGRAEAVAAGTFFCLRDQNPMQTRARISNAGLPIRTET